MMKLIEKIPRPTQKKDKMLNDTFEEDVRQQVHINQGKFGVDKLSVLMKNSRHKSRSA